jgi:hypothetical protein
MALAALVAFGCDKKKTDAPQPSEPTATATTTVAPAPSDTGPADIGPAGAASKEDRERAALDLLAGGPPATRLPIESVDEGKSFDRDLRDRLAPRAPEKLVDVDVSVGEPPGDAREVVARMKPRFRRCYQNGLKSNPNLAGSLVFKVDVGAKGDVTRVRMITGRGDLGSIVECLKGVVSGARFAQPDGGSTTITIPITFVNPK